MDCLARTEAELGRHLADFTYAAHREKTDGVYFKYWIRDLEWKRDEVVLSRKSHTSPNLIVSLQVALPCGDDDRWVLDGRPVNSLVGRSASYWFPGSGLMRERRERAFASKVSKDTVKALSWFEGYGSAAECLRRLEAGETSYGLVRGRPYREMAAYLRRQDARR